MKYIKLQLFSDGSVRVLRNDLQFYTENLAAELHIEYPREWETFYKFVDFNMGDGTAATRPVDVWEDGNTLVIPLTAELLKPRYILIQPFAVGGDGGERILWEKVYLPIEDALNVLNDTAYPDPTPLEAALANKIDLDGLNSNLDELHFDTTPTSTDTLLAGQLRWNTTDGTIELGMNGGGVIQSIGLENYYHITNQTGSQINDGVLVMFNGSIGGSGRLKAKKWDTTSPEFYIMGIATENIPNGDDGFITWHGPVNGIQTNGVNYGETWVDGDILYPSTTIQGGLTKVANSFAPVAAVVRARASNGQLYVRCK